MLPASTEHDIVAWVIILEKKISQKRLNNKEKLKIYLIVNEINKNKPIQGIRKQSRNIQDKFAVLL